MFPETLLGIAQQQGEEIVPSTQYFQGHQTAVGRLAEPAQMLKQAIVNLINYQDDAEVAAKAIPELIRLLQDNDEQVVCQAAHIAHQMSRKEASRYPMLQNKEMVPTIIRAMMETNNPTTHKDLSATLRNLSHHRQGLICIFKNGGIPALLRMLTSTVDAVVFYAITTLHNLIRFQEGAKHAIQVAGGIKIMVALLSKDHHRFLAINCDCLQMLCFGSQENKITALSAGCPQECVRILRQYPNYEKLQWTCIRLLKVLSVCTSNKPKIVEAGGMSALGNVLHSDSTRVVQNALWTLRNLSDAAVREVGLDSLLETLVRFLNNTDIAVLQCAAGILSNLTCNNPENKRIVCEAGGVSMLVETMHRGGAEHEDLTEPSVCALRHLTSRHQDAEQARTDVIARNGLQCLMTLVQNSRLPLKKAVIGLLRNMALSDSNQDVLRQHEVVAILCNHLNGLQHDLVSDAAGQLVDGVSVEDIGEGVCGALHILARYKANHGVMASNNIVGCAVKLLKCHNQNIQRAATGLLCELAVDQQLAQMIDQEKNAMQQFACLLHSKNEAVATYAAATMLRLSERQSEEKRKHTSLTLQKELFNTHNMEIGGNSTLGRSEQYATSKLNNIDLAANDASRDYGNEFNHYGSAQDHSVIDRQQTIQYDQAFGQESTEALLSEIQLNQGQRQEPGSPANNFQDTDL
jgi:catenin beta 1